LVQNIVQAYKKMQEPKDNRKRENE
jgi:hypothetical protein